jgi:hypothetical protein
MSNHEHIYIGKRNDWGNDTLFGLSHTDRRQHVYIVGQTGTGKSTLLLNSLIQDIALGHGCGLIDPHGDLAEELLRHIPPHRVRDVVYFNATDTDHPIGFNLLARVEPALQHLAASDVVEVFKSIWGESWGPRMEYLLYACTAALMECQNVTLLAIPRLLTDPNFREWVVKQVNDPAVRAFWCHDFERYSGNANSRSGGFGDQAVDPVINKVGRLLMARPLRNILGQVGNSLDLPFIMDHGRILIANLSKGSLGADKADLLGSFLVNRFQLAAMGRVHLGTSSRRPFYLYVDEFQNFATDSFQTILSESRKYGLSLTLAHQHLRQVPERITNAVFGNIGTMISFRVGEHDAELLAAEYGGTRPYSAGRFSGLANYEICVKLLEHGSYGEPFVGRTLPPLEMDHGRCKQIVRFSRERYGTPQEVVEGRISRWIGL